MQSIVFNFWAVIILFGAAQGLFLSIYIFTKRENRNANKWLALLLTAISLHLLEYGTTISGISLKYPFLIASTYPLLFCLGPFYLLYSRCLLDKNYKAGGKSLLHFIPSVLVLLLMLPFYSLPATEKRDFIQNLEVNGQLVIPTEQLVFMASHVIQMVIYMYASYRFIKKRELELKEATSDALLIKKISWLNAFSFYFGIYLVLYILLVMVLAFIHSYQVQIDYVMLLLTSFAIYAIGYSAIQSPEIFKALPDFEPQSIELDTQKTPARIKDGSRFTELKEKLLLHMENNRPYLKSDLKISELADSLSVPSHQLSELINTEFLVNFYDFVNKFRVDEAKKLLLEESQNAKILALAYEVGFNSKATFNRVFKKFTGLTPSAFKDEFSRSSGSASASRS